MIIGEIGDTWVKILKTQFNVQNAYCSTSKYRNNFYKKII